MKASRFMKLFSAFLCVIIIFCSLEIVARAYQFNGYILSNPSNVKYKIGSSVTQYASSLRTYTETWETYCDEITISYTTSSENIYFYGELTVSNGTYASTYHNSNDYHVITFYKGFVNATTLQKNETIVHEVGHALGLAHCQTGRENISVMRAKDFNGKAYPLSDDISGIAYLY